MTATGTSPRRSMSASSSPSSWSKRFAHDSPAVPPPTMATPTSMRSSSESSSRLMNSLRGSTGGGKSLGACAGCSLLPAIGSAPLLRLDRLGELGHDLVQIAHDPKVGELEDRRVG